MLLSARLLSDVCGVNRYSYADNVVLMESDSATIYLQLVDISVEPNLRPEGRRYMPVALSTLAVTMKSHDTGATVSKTATQPFPQDPSIWSFDLTATNTLPGTDSLQLALSEPTDDPEAPKVTNGWVQSAITVRPLSPEF